MINTDQIHRLIESNDSLHNLAIDLMTHDHDELLAICIHPQSLATLAGDYDTSPATIARFAQSLTDPHIYTELAHSLEICPIHRCDHEICESDDLHPYA